MEEAVETMYNITFIFRYLASSNMKSHFSYTWLSLVNQKNEKIRNWSLLLKIISTVPNLLFFKTTNYYYLFFQNSITFHSNPYFGYSTTFTYFSYHPLWIYYAARCVHFTVPSGCNTFFPVGADVHIWQHIHQKD